MNAVSPMKAAATPRSGLDRLTLMAASVGFGQSALIALIPVVVARTGLDAPRVGAIAFLGAVVFLIAAPAWGHRGAHIGLRRLFVWLAAMMMVGHGLLALALFAGPLPAGLALLVLALSRITYSVGAAGVMPHAQAAVVAATRPDRRPAALARLAAGLGVGRIAGSLVTLAGAAAWGAPLLLLVASPLLLLGAPHGQAAPGGPRQAIWSTVNRRTAPLLALAFAMTFGLGQIQMVLGLFLQQRLGVDADVAARLAGIVYALVAVVMIAVQVGLVPRLAPRLARNMRLGVAAFACGCALVAVADAYGTVLAGAALAGAGIALATPAYTTCLVARVPAQGQAGAAGWLASVHVLGQGTGALVGGATFALAAALPFAICAGLGALVWATLLLLRDAPPEADEPP